MTNFENSDDSLNHPLAKIQLLFHKPQWFGRAEGALIAISSEAPHLRREQLLHGNGLGMENLVGPGKAFHAFGLGNLLLAWEGHSILCWEALPLAWEGPYCFMLLPNYFMLLAWEGHSISLWSPGKAILIHDSSL